SKGLAAGFDSAVFRNDFGPTTYFNRGCMQRKLRDHHFAAIEFFTMMKTRIFPSRQSDDGHTVLQRFDDDVITVDVGVQLRIQLIAHCGRTSVNAYSPLLGVILC